MRHISLAALGLVAALGACGYSTADRALSGGALGAGTGAAGAAITGYDPLAGAAIGGAIGAAVGGLTDARDIDLGDPIWRRY
jgi:osmotically inducible lipoprotein OsmB